MSSFLARKKGTLLPSTSSALMARRKEFVSVPLLGNCWFSVIHDSQVPCKKQTGLSVICPFASCKFTQDCDRQVGFAVPYTAVLPSLAIQMENTLYNCSTASQNESWVQGSFSRVISSIILYFHHVLLCCSSLHTAFLLLLSDSCFFTILLCKLQL